MLTNATAHIAKPIGMHLDNHINAKDLVDVGNFFFDAFTTLLQGHQRHCTMWTMDICGSKELHNAHEKLFFGTVVSPATGGGLQRWKNTHFDNSNVRPHFPNIR